MNGDDVVQLAAELIRIDSSNPDLVATGAGEAAIAQHVTSWLTTRGFACTIVGRTERPSVIATHAGSGGGRSLMLNGHLDTVSLESYEGDALEPRIADGKLHGRGAYDMKGGVAAMMVAAARVAATPHRGDIVLTLVADEESGSAGTEEVLRHVRADAAIVAEPTDETIVLAHRGFVWIDVDVSGVAAHGSRRDLGVDAIVDAGAFLAALGRHDRDLQARPAHPILDTGSVHASLIRGGEERSSYPAACSISLERRTLPGETGASVLAEIEAVIAELHGVRCTFDARVVFERSPFSVTPDEPIVGALSAAVAAAGCGDNMPRTAGAAYWTDCALIADAGIPAVLFGVAGAGAHAADEWIDLRSLVTVTRTLERLLSTFTAV